MPLKVNPHQMMFNGPKRNEISDIGSLLMCFFFFIFVVSFPRNDQELPWLYSHRLKISQLSLSSNQILMTKNKSILAKACLTEISAALLCHSRAIADVTCDWYAVSQMGKSFRSESLCSLANIVQISFFQLASVHMHSFHEANKTFIMKAKKKCFKKVFKSLWHNCL